MENLNYIPKYTFKDYKIWKGDWELIEGHPIAMSPSAKMNHQIVAGNLFTKFNVFFNSMKTKCNCRALYEIDWKVNDNTVLRPDIAIICTNEITDFIEQAPFLIVEVLSSSTQLKDRNTKYTIYQENGVKYYLLVDTKAKKIEIYHLIDKKYKEVFHSSFVVNEHCKIDVDFETVFT